MADYKKLYFKLFNGITDEIERLKELQLKCEELYINMPDDEDETEESK